MDKTADDSSNKIATKPSNSEEALINIDAAIDQMVAAVQSIEENIGSVTTETLEEGKALKQVKDLVDTAIAPYLLDIIKEMEKFDTA